MRVCIRLDARRSAARRLVLFVCVFGQSKRSYFTGLCFMFKVKEAIFGRIIALKVKR